MVRLARAMGTATPRRRMPRQQYPHLVEVEYGRMLRGVVAAARDAVAPLLAQLPHLTRIEAVAMIEGARRRVAAMVPRLVPTVARFATRTVDHQAAQLDAQCRAVLGIGIDMLGIAKHTAVPASVHMDAADPDILAVGWTRVTWRMDARVRAQTVDERVQGFITENVALIKSLGDTPLEEIEALVTRAFAAGARHETLASDIVARFGVAEDRAKLIARDQIGKLNGRISSDRHQRMGLRRFIWRDVGDSRVRPAHRKLAAGNAVYEYANPPSEGLPGEPIQCRCHDEPIFDDVLDELDRLEAAPSPLVAPTLPRPSRGRATFTAPNTVLVPGFDTSKHAEGGSLFDGVPKVHKGIPARSNLSTTTYRKNAYEFRPSELLGEKLRGITSGDDMTTDPRTMGIVRAWKAGENVPVIEIDVDKKGYYFVADGNHRLLAAALDGDRPVLARFRPVAHSVAGMDPIGHDLTQALGKP
jgi:SPP1 gp7 family putative phage head morphogenesis protein